MKRLHIALTIIIGLSALRTLSASGPLGIYGIIEKVVFEPSETHAERVQLWGAFAIVDGTPGTGLQVSAPERGYLYFQMPWGLSAQAEEMVQREWRDFKAVAGTGQAVGFGYWGYVGAFNGLTLNGNNRGYVLEGRGSGRIVQLIVRPTVDPEAKPVTYTTNVGVVKLSAAGAQAEIVKQLKAALASR